MSANVRFGSKADMCSAKRHVRSYSKADICSAKRHVRFVPKADIDWRPSALSAALLGDKSAIN